MKKQLLLLLFCAVSFVRLNAQANMYHAFPDSNAFWQYKHTNVLHSNVHDQKRLGLDGDTVISAVTYHKVYSLFDSTINSPWSTYYGAVREQNKKVFGRVGNGPETLLYDFNLLVGDTIKYTYSLTTNMPDTFCSVLTNIDSMLMKDGKYRKRYAFDPVFPKNNVKDTVVEGLGSICFQGLFDPLINAFCTCGDVYQVTCIKTYDTTRYLKNPDCDHCFCTFLTSVNSSENQISNQIYPNPFTSKTVLSSSRELTNATLTMYNSTGQQVYQMKNMNDKSITIQRNGLPAGIYFVQLKEGNALLANEKIIICD